MANEAIDKLEILLKKNEHLLCKLINFSEENLISGKNEEVIQILSLGSFPSKKLDRLPIWKKIVTKIITSQGRYRRSLTKNQGFPEILVVSIGFVSSSCVGWWYREVGRTFVVHFRPISDFQIN